MKTVFQILTPSISTLASIWRGLQWRKRANLQREAHDCYAAFMSKEITPIKNETSKYEIN